MLTIQHLSGTTCLATLHGRWSDAALSAITLHSYPNMQCQAAVPEHPTRMHRLAVEPSPVMRSWAVSVASSINILYEHAADQALVRSGEAVDGQV